MCTTNSTEVPTPTWSDSVVSLTSHRSGADKVSIGSDAVEVAEEYLRTRTLTGTTSIEQISAVYGRQAVVVSIDPRRVYVSDPGQVERLS